MKTMAKIDNFFYSVRESGLTVLFCYFWKMITSRSQILLCLLVLYFLSCPVYSQYYNTGQDPSSLKWMQIKTPRFNVIYPSTYGSGGADFAASLENAYLKLSDYYTVRNSRIPVIIHNHTTNSNGYVAWAPKRMEIYPTPEQNTIPVDPVTQLAIHEMTHVMQMESLNTGFTRAMTMFFGEQFTGAVAALVPLWYLEGDAVFAESILTGSGRGRSPSFNNRLRAITVENGKLYGYDKILNGSYRDFVPDHYESGFQMVAWARLNFDSKLWYNTLNFTGRMPYSLNPFNINLSRNASLTKAKLFSQAFDTLKTIWTEDDNRSESESYPVLNPSGSRIYTNYHSPVYVGTDTIIAIKTSLSSIPSFVAITGAGIKEKKIHTPGNIYPFNLSAGAGKIVWVETVNDPVWENRSWSVVKIMDINNREVKQLTSRTRYMAASISPDGRYIASTENTTDNKNSLVIISPQDGTILESHPSPGNTYLQRPQWDATGKKITVINLTAEGEGIMVFSLEDKSWITLIESGSNDLQSTYLRNDSLFYVSSVSGTDNIWLKTPDGNDFPLTKSRFGASDLHIRGKSILFSDYTSSGSNVCRTVIPGSPLDGDFHDSNSTYLINAISSRPTDSVPAFSKHDFIPRPYIKWHHLFKFHSWMPFYADIDLLKTDPSAVRPGLTIMTQNNLSTLVSSLAYEYSGNRHKLHSKIEWFGWPVIVESRIDYGTEPVVERFGNNSAEVGNPAEINPGMEITTRVALPLYFNNGRFIKSLNISSSMINQNKYLYSPDNFMYDTWQTHFTSRLFFSNYQRRALRDIYPKWAQLIDLSHTFSPVDKEFYGSILSARSAFYFPGFTSSAGLRLTFEYEKQDIEKFMWNSRISFPRSFDDVLARQVEFFSADYYMPLFYPDFNIGSLLYMNRIRSDMFFDLARTEGRLAGQKLVNYGEVFKSFGFELMSDFYLLRMPFRFSAGVQAAWRSFGYEPYFRFLFNIDIFGMSISRTRL